MAYLIRTSGENSLREGRELAVTQNTFSLAQFGLRFGDISDKNTLLEVEYLPDEPVTDFELLNGRLTFNSDTRLLRHIDSEQERLTTITPQQSKIFRSLINPPNTIRTRDYLLDKISDKKRSSPHTVDVHLSEIRKALYEKSERLRTIRGIGFIFDN